MRTVRTWCIIATLFAAPTFVAAQTTNGTISGHVVDAQGLALPGVTVSAASPNLQGLRSTTTSENGSYILTLLPPGVYTVTFELSGFEKVVKSATLAPTQTLPIDVALGVAGVSEAVNVVGRAGDVLTQTSQVATNFKQELISTLPTTRDINATLLLSPSVHPTGPGGQISISGATSFESLFLVNGVTVNENLRGQANNLYIEDAIEETTIASAGISAEYGRFSGGVVNVITKSGGNLFTGSLRDTLGDDDWRSLTLLPSGTPLPGNRALTVPSDASVCGTTGHEPCSDGAAFPNDVTFAKVIPTYEYTFGGPVTKDHLWFFTAGRLQKQTANRQLFVTNVPYAFTDDQKRYEGKLTYSANANHRVQAAYTKIVRDQLNGNQFNVMDTTSLYSASLPQDLFTLNYNGILSRTIFVEGRYSARHSRTTGIGSSFTDLINGTLVTDRTRGTRYWTSTFCGVCDPEDRDNDDVFVKGSYFLSKKGLGSQDMTFGYDGFNDKRFANNHQSGSDWRILGTTSIVRGTTIYPQFLGNGSTLLQYNPITLASEGTNFRTHSLFYNDNWRVTSHATVNLGLRWDKNHGVDSAGNLTASDSALSPRLGLVWDPTGQGRWSVSGSFAKYVAAIANSIADGSSAGGNSSTLDWVYAGPSINPGANASTLITTPAAIQQVFDWFNANGGTRITPVFASIAGLSVRIPQSLESPHVIEYAAGVSRQLKDRAAVRADFVYRDYRDFYSQRIDTSTGKVADQFGNQSDISIIENTNALKRRYTGLTLSSTYRVTARTDVGTTYTLSRLWGNFDGENTTSGPLATDIFQYPEYRNQSWYAPEGDLAADQRHRLKLWINYGVPKIDGLTLSALQDVSSGLPYGAVGLVDARPYVANPGYATPQGASTENYYFTARDAFRTQASIRTDLATSYNYGIKAGSRRMDLFVQAQVLNLFNQFQLCGCGDSVFNTGGPVLLTRIGQAVLTNANSPALQRFNPLATTPVEGVNWNLGPNFGTALNRLSYSSPRTFRLTFGVRF